MYGGGDSAMGLFPLSAAFLSAGGIGTRGKPLETVGRKARGCGAGQPHYARSAAIRQTVGNGGAAKPEAKAHLRYARSVTEFFASKNGQRREDLFMKNSKLFRRGFAWLLTLSMCLGMLQVTAFAEETEASAGGDVTVSVVNVSSDAPQESSSDTAAAQQESSTPPADTPSSDAADTEDSTAPADSSDNTENPENDTPKADASEDAEDSESPVLPAVDSDDETDENNADKQAEQNEEETPEAAEDDAAGQDGTFNLAQIERPEQSEDVSCDKGTADDKLSLEDKNWDIFYDPDKDVYKITFNIDKDADSKTQVIDLTYALELLEKYAETGKQELENAINKLDKPVMGDAGSAPVLGTPEMEMPVEPEVPESFEGEAPVEPVEPAEPGKPEGLDENLDAAYDAIVESVPRDAEGEPAQNFDYAGLVAEKTGLDRNDPFVKESAAHMYDQAMVDWVMDSWDKWESEGHMYAKHFGDPDTMLFYGCGITVKWPEGPNKGTPVLKNPAPEFKVDETSPAYQEYLSKMEEYQQAVEDYKAEKEAYDAALQAWMEENAEAQEQYERLMEAYLNDKAAYEAEVERLAGEYNAAVAEYEAKKAELERKYDKDSKAYEEAVKALKAEFDRRVGANILQPGDVKKFELYLTSDSLHTYKYQTGSFTLATADMGKFMAGLKELWENDPEAYKSKFQLSDGRWIIDPNKLDINGEGFAGFDGQILAEDYGDHAKYYVTMTAGPMQDLFHAIGMTDPNNPLNANNILSDGSVSLDCDKNGNIIGYPNYWESEVKKYLNQFEGETMAEKLNTYLLDYYNSKDGTSYTTIDELMKNNTDARAELSKTTTNGNKWFKLDDETFVVDAHLETVKYDTFYKQLFSFAFGDAADIDALLGEMKFNPDTNRWEYENKSWTDNGAQNALFYYMDHQEIWEKTDRYFQTLLNGGLSAEQATWTSLMMALNIDGELTGNDWQDTAWPWYSSIQLERMDIDFSLTKKDGETGEAITDSETGFQVYYIDKVTNEDGTVSNVNMYCTFDAETKSYTFVTTPSTVWTKDGQLNIDYAMMKDIVYYLQEVTAPEGYELDTNVYIVMSEEDYKKLSDEERAELEGKFDKFLDLEKSEDGLSVSTDFVNVRIVPPAPDKPTPPTTPDEPNRDPDVDVPEPEVPLSNMPEEPFVDIPEEDVPLADTPEEVEIDDPEVPMGDVPRTGDAPVFPLAAAALCICGMLLAKLGKGNKEM